MDIMKHVTKYDKLNLLKGVDGLDMYVETVGNSKYLHVHYYEWINKNHKFPQSYKADEFTDRQVMADNVDNILNMLGLRVSLTLI